MDISASVFSDWLEAQRSIFNSWHSATGKEDGRDNNIHKEQHSFDPLQAWANFLQHVSAPAREMQHLYMQTSFDVYRRFMHFNADALQALQPSLQPWHHGFADEVKKMLDPWGLSRQIEGNFNINPEEFASRMAHNTYAMANSSFSDGGKVMESYWKMLAGARLAPGWMFSDPLAMQALLLPMLRAMTPAFASFFMPGMQTSNPNRQAEYFLNVQEKTIAFSKKMAEMMTLVFDTAHEAYSQLSQYKQQEAGSSTDYKAAYNEWSRVNEIMFTALYAKPAFTHLQDEISLMGLELRTAYQKAFELMLEPFPVVLRARPDAYGAQESADQSRIQQLEEKVNRLQEKLMQLSVQQQESMPGRKGEEASNGVASPKNNKE